MKVAIITGSAGLIGSEAVSFLQAKGFKVVGLDNDLRSYFFGAEGSTNWKKVELEEKLKNYHHHSIDIRSEESINEIFQKYGEDIEVVIHTAAQPSHDWAAKEPLLDFHVNATGTLHLLEATRKFAPKSSFIFTSTNKVYGDRPNLLPLQEGDKRFELAKDHHFFNYGIDESMSIDQSKHSLFGVSKASADLMVQEYGRYFGLKTAIFRGGCLTGPAHSGAELHGFLAYLVRCALTGRPYTIFGYRGKQVRDNIHSNDLVSAFYEFYENPKSAAVYNIGGGRFSNCSILEAIEIIDHLAGKKVNFTLSDQERSGDHIWWVSDTRKFQRDYPNWKQVYDIKTILNEIILSTEERLKKESTKVKSNLRMNL